MITLSKLLINFNDLCSLSPTCGVQGIQISQYTLKGDEDRGDVCGCGEETTIYENIKDRDRYPGPWMLAFSHILILRCYT